MAPSWLRRLARRHLKVLWQPRRKACPGFQPWFEALDERVCPSLTGLRTYAVGPPNSIPSGPNAVAVGDLNGGGKPDLVVANGTAGISVLLNNGDGTFAAAVNSPTGGANVSSVAVGFGGIGTIVGTDKPALAIGDLNGDGKPDLAVTSSITQVNGQVGSAVVVLFNDGTGNFNANLSLVLKVGNQPSAIALADMNHDGHLDILTANTHDGTVSELLGNGNGTFQGLRNFGVGTQPVALAVGDLNGDGIPDIVAGLAGGQVTVLTGKGNGSFSTAGSFNSGSTITSLALGDLNGDGKLDVVTAGGSGTVNVLAGFGNGTLAPALSFSTGAGPVAVAVADFNGDGRLDVVTAGSDGVSILLNDGLWPPLPPPSGGAGGGGGGGGGA